MHIRSCLRPSHHGSGNVPTAVCAALLDTAATTHTCTQTQTQREKERDNHVRWPTFLCFQACTATCVRKSEMSTNSGLCSLARHCSHNTHAHKHKHKERKREITMLDGRHFCVSEHAPQYRFLRWSCEKIGNANKIKMFSRLIRNIQTGNCQDILSWKQKPSWFRQARTQPQTHTIVTGKQIGRAHV